MNHFAERRFLSVGQKYRRAFGRKFSGFWLQIEFTAVRNGAIDPDPMMPGLVLIPDADEIFPKKDEKKELDPLEKIAQQADEIFKVRNS